MSCNSADEITDLPEEIAVTPECEINNISIDEMNLFDEIANIQSVVLKDDQITILYNHFGAKLASYSISNSNINWTKSYDGIGFNHIASENGNFLIAGKKNNKNWILEINETGEYENEIYNDQEKTRSTHAIHKTNNGEIITFGRIYNEDYPQSPRDLELLKFGDNGSLIWQKSIDRSEYDQANEILKLDNENLLLCYTWRLSSHSVSFGLIEIDLNGNILREKKFDEYDEMLVPDIQINNSVDGGFLLSTNMQESSNDNTFLPFILKLDYNYEMEWAKLHDDNKSIQRLLNIKELSNGDILVVGANHDEECFDGNNIYVSRLKSSGIKLWENTYGDFHYAKAVEIVEIDSDNFIVIGDVRNEEDLIARRAFILALDSDGNPL